ncbi:hypothetical protein HDV03_003201 [Kappamyces sp. JEL0829]|nr:hypothetical protein HDV03_003201 [Kappamyces sp. JEL0829]
MSVPDRPLYQKQLKVGRLRLRLWHVLAALLVAIGAAVGIALGVRSASAPAAASTSSAGSAGTQQPLATATSVPRPSSSPVPQSTQPSTGSTTAEQQFLSKLQNATGLQNTVVQLQDVSLQGLDSIGLSGLNIGTSDNGISLTATVTLGGTSLPSGLPSINMLSGFLGLSNERSVKFQLRNLSFGSNSVTLSTDVLFLDPQINAAKAKKNVAAAIKAFTSASGASSLALSVMGPIRVDIPGAGLPDVSQATQDLNIQIPSSLITSLASLLSSFDLSSLLSNDALVKIVNDSSFTLNLLKLSLDFNALLPGLITLPKFTLPTQVSLNVDEPTKGTPEIKATTSPLQIGMSSDKISVAGTIKLEPLALQGLIQTAGPLLTGLLSQSNATVVLGQFNIFDSQHSTFKFLDQLSLPNQLPLNLPLCDKCAARVLVGKLLKNIKLL